MADYTPILNLPEVAPNQTQKEATINTALAILEAAMNDAIAISLLSGNITLNTDQFTKYFHHQFFGATGARVVTIPATPRWFSVENQGLYTITLKTTTGSTSSQVAELPAGKVGLIISDGEDVRFVVPDPTGGTGTLEDLSNVNGGATDGQVIRWVAADGRWEPWTLTLRFRDLSDVPNSYSGQGGKIVAVKSDGSGLEFITSAANINSFVDLDDTPSSYSGANNRTVKVNSGGTGLIFAQPKLTEATDFPANFTGASEKFLRVNLAANAVEFDSIVFDDIADGPGSPATGDEGKFLRVKSDGSGLEYSTGTGGPDKFTELLDTPNAYTGAAKSVVRVNSATDALEFHAPAFIDGTDTPNSLTGAQGKFVQVNSGGTALQFNFPTVQDLSNGPGSMSGQAKRIVRVNTTSDALEYAIIPITDLSGFPSSFAGQGGKFLSVKLDETGIQFSSSSVVTNFLALTDTPSSYSGKAGQFTRVNGGESGLEFVTLTIPTNLNSLSDVDLSTGTPASGSVLTYKDGVWSAEPATGGGGADSLGELSDVDLSTGTPASGAVLTYKGGVWNAEIPAAPGATNLNQLTDVDLSTGTPATGSVLTYKDGVWSAEQPASDVTAFTELTDVPADYTGDGGKYVRVKGDESGLEFVSGGGSGASTFTDLTDVPSTYVSQAGKLVAVNSTEDALEFRVSHEVDYRGPYGADVVDITANFDSGIPPVFTDAATVGWTVVTKADSTAGTTHALQSLDISELETTDIHFEVLGDVGGSTMTVRYLVSSEGGFDKFHILVDGSVVFTDSGNTGAYEFTNVALDEGNHTITFRYAKDNSGSAGDDCVYISQVIYPTLDGEPFVQGDTVDFDSARYMCLADNTILDPSNSSDWVRLGPQVIPTLGELPDVDISTGSPEDEQVLSYSGGVWSPRTIQEGGKFRGTYEFDVTSASGIFDSGFPAEMTDANESGWEIVSLADSGVGTSKSLKSRAIGADEFTSWKFNIYIDSGFGIPGVTGRYKVSSAATGYVKILVDGVEKVSDSGNTGSFEDFDTGSLSDGHHVVEVMYTKVGGTVAGDDCVYFSYFSYSTLSTYYKANDIVDVSGSRYIALVDYPTAGTSDSSEWQPFGGGGGTLEDLTDVNVDIPTVVPFGARYALVNRGFGWVESLLGRNRYAWDSAYSLLNCDFQVPGEMPYPFSSAQFDGWVQIDTNDDPDNSDAIYAITPAPTLGSGDETMFDMFLPATTSYNTVSFRYAIDGADTFSILVDGVEAYTKTGPQVYTDDFITLTEGTHTLTWKFAKATSGSETMYIDGGSVPDIAEQFVQYDIVTYHDERYMCVEDFVMTDPSDTDNWQKLGGSGAGAEALGDLTDVDLSTGTPDEGDVLTYHNGVWNSEPPQATGAVIRGEVVNHYYGANAGGQSITLGASPAVGNWLVVVMGSNDFTAPTAAGDWIRYDKADDGASYLSVGIYYKKVVTGDTATITPTTNAAPSNPYAVYEFKNLAAGFPASFTDHYIGVTPGSFSTTGTASLLVAAFQRNASVNIVVAGTTYDFNETSGNGHGRDVTSAGVVLTNEAVTPSITFDGSGDQKAAVVLLVNLDSGVSSFTALSDTPTNYVGKAHKSVRVNGGESGLEFYTNNLTELSDVDVSTGTPATGAVLMYKDGIWSAETPAASTIVADVQTFTSGVPGDSETIIRIILASALSVLSTGHQGSAEFAATASTVFTVRKNGVSIGTATFAAAGTTPTFSITATSFAAGDILSITAQGSADVTLANISLTLRANRQ